MTAPRFWGKTWEEIEAMKPKTPADLGRKYAPHRHQPIDYAIPREWPGEETNLISNPDFASDRAWSLGNVVHIKNGLPPVSVGQSTESTVGWHWVGLLFALGAFAAAVYGVIWIVDLVRA